MSLSPSLLVALTLVAQASSDDLPSERESLRLTNCIVSAVDDIQLPVEVAGVIQRLETEEGAKVEAGTIVRAGQSIGKLDDEDAAARRVAADLGYKVASAEGLKALATVDAAEKTEEVAQAELEESEEVNRRVKDAIPRTQIRRQQLTVARAASETEVAKRDVEVAGFTSDLRQAELAVADINLKKHGIISPLNGIVVQMYRQRGEWVSPGDPLARIVRLDTLRVEGFVRAADYLPEDLDGRTVTVTVKRANRPPERFQSTITFVSPIIDSSGEYRIWADVANRPVGDSQRHWVMLPGMEVEMEVDLRR